jgi:DNA-binding NarL/FixJ family response regulator
MSNIPRARDLLAGVLRNYSLPTGAAATITKAVSLMVRKSPVKRATAVRPKIDRSVRAEVQRLARQGLSNHEIAQATGLRNGGRVSEILTGKR